MKPRCCLELQLELMEGYTSEEFQMKLCAGWHATDDVVEKHEWRQRVCLEVQSVVLPKYGFEGSRRGVWASGKACEIMNITDLALGTEINGNYLFMNWLTNPDNVESGLPPNEHFQNRFFHLSPKEGERPSSEYTVHLTKPEHDSAIFDIAHCQGALAGAHQATYKSAYPDMELQQWFGLLGCKSIREALDRGVLIFHAESVDTGRVAGYISCTCFYGDGREGEEEGSESFAHINNIIVLKHHRGHGVGKMLYDGLMDHLSVACPSVLKDMRISVADKNTRAKEWYERLGFVAVDSWKVFPSNCEVDLIKMQRKMDASDFDDIFA